LDVDADAFCGPDALDDSTDVKFGAAAVFSSLAEASAGTAVACAAAMASVVQQPAPLIPIWYSCRCYPEAK